MCVFALFSRTLAVSISCSCTSGIFCRRFLTLPNGTGEWELFDLKLDPGELNDLAKKHPQKLEKLVNRWQQYEEKNGVLDLSSGGG